MSASSTLAATGNFWLALIVASLLIALLGAAIYLTTLRPLIGRDPLTTILATFGISLVLQNYALWQFGPVARKIQEPFTGHFTLFYLDYPWYRLVDRAARRRRSSAGSGCSSNSAPTASGSAPPRRTGSWRRRWASRCRGY